METVADFLFLGSKITADGDCSHEIKRCLLFRRKAMMNLDSVLKSRDITLPTKVRSQSSNFSGSHIWMRELDHKEGWALENWCFGIVVQKTSECPLKEINPECSLEGLMLKQKLQYFGHLMGRAYSLEKTLMLGKIEGRRRRKRQRMRVGWHHWLNGHESEKTQGDSEGQRRLACCSSWGCKESDMT